MNLGASVAVIRQRTVGEVLDLAFRFLVTFVRTYGALSAAVLIPGIAATLALHYLTDASWQLVWLLGVTIAYFFEAPFAVLTSRLLFGENPGVLGTLRLYRGRAGAHVGATLVSAFYTTLMIGIPAIAAWYAFVDEAVLLENASPVAAQARSRRIAAEGSGSAFLIMLASLVARVGAAFLFDVLGNALLDDILQLGRPFGDLVRDGGSALAVVGLFAATPFVAVARFLAYINIRTRSDAWDVQVKFMDLASRDAAVAR